MDLLQLLRNNLSAEKFMLLKMAGEIALEEGLLLYLVGGTVRDLLLGRSSEDLDLVIEGDAETLAYIIAKKLSGEVTSRSQFSTAKIKVGDVSLDLITARSEHYRRPGALPQIAHGTIGEDMARRDFSINSMAFSIHEKSNTKPLDSFGGMSDLNNRVIRVLHDRSFVDDATRIMRAVRYEQRLCFHIENDTEALLRRDIPMLSTISGDRLYKELQFWLKEERCASIITRADNLGILKAIFPSLAGSSATMDRVAKRVEMRGIQDEVNLGLLVYSLTKIQGDELIERFRMTRRWARVVRDTIAIKEKLSWFSVANLSPAKLYQALAISDTSAIRACALANPIKNARDNLNLFLEKLSHVKPSLSGRDIVGLGVPKGPIVGSMLVKLRLALLENTAVDRSEEVALVKRWLKIGDDVL